MGQGLEGMDPPAEIPERIGRYEILLPIARGGAGLVYLARARGPGGFEREVALKLLHPSLSPGERRAFELVEEAKLAVLIRHPHVVRVFDVDEGPLGVFMSMEYIEGASLAGLLAAVRACGAGLPPEIGLRILLDALAGLHAAHELAGDDGRPLGLVHRDFSPQNILVGVDGASRLADFGIAKAATRSAHTVTGMIKGKVAYMAPEQISGGALDRRCDVWAAGVVAWQILAGQHMHEGAEDVALMYRIVHEPAPRLRARGIDVPIELDEAIARALTRDVSARCPTAAAFARTLEATGVDVATDGEVAAYLRRFLGPELAERRARITEILERRRSSARDAASTPTPESAPEPALALAPPHPPPPPAPPLPSPAPRARGLRALAIGAALALTTLTAAVAWRALRPTSAAAEAAPAALRGESAAAAAMAEDPVQREPAPAPAMQGSAMAPADAAPSAALPSAAPPAPSPQPAATAPAAHPARATSKRGARPPLAPSPYGKTP